MKAKIVGPGDGARLNVLGDNQTVRLAGEDTGGVFALVEQSNPPGVGVPMHFHENEDELFHVIEGHMEFTLDDRTVHAGPDTTVFLPRGVPHGFKVIGDSPARALVMVFPAGNERMFAELSQLPAGQPDMASVGEICGRYGVKFVTMEAPAS